METKRSYRQAHVVLLLLLTYCTGHVIAEVLYTWAETERIATAR